MQDKERAVFSFQNSSSALHWDPGAPSSQNHSGDCFEQCWPGSQGFLEQEHKTLRQSKKESLAFILGCIPTASLALRDASFGEEAVPPAGSSGSDPLVHPCALTAGAEPSWVTWRLVLVGMERVGETQQPPLC